MPEQAEVPKEPLHSEQISEIVRRLQEALILLDGTSTLGHIGARLQEVIDRLQSYTERSLS